MRTFAQKQKPTQQSKTVSSSTHSRAWSPQSQTVRSILHLQRTIENQGTQRLLQLNAEELKAGSTTIVSTDFGHDFSRIPIFSPSSLQVQPKLMINTPGDIYEQEADRIAEHVMRMPDSTVQRQAEEEKPIQTKPIASTITPLVQRQTELEEEEKVLESVSTRDAGELGEEEEEELLQPKTNADATPQITPIIAQDINSFKGTGQPLPASERAFFEPRFGTDFSAVRLHNDTQAANLNRSINATAFTLGHNVVFGPGEYSPQTSAGKKLLAHELTHVVQQRGGATNNVQCKKTKKAKTLWYQDAIDEDKTTRNYVVPIYSVALVRIVLELTKAIDKGAKSDITAKLTKLIAGDAKELPLMHPSDRLVEQMHSRLLMLGMAPEARRLRNWHVTVNMVRRERPKRGGREYTTEDWLFDNALEMAQAAIKSKDPASSLRGLKGAVTTIGEMRDEVVGLDPKKLKEDRKARAEFSAGAGSVAWMIWGKTISVYEDSLVESIKQGFGVALEAWEAVLEQAITDLQKGSGVTWLNALEAQGKALQGIVFPKNIKHRLGALEVESTRSEFGESKGTHLDRFLKGKAAKRRSVGFRYYEREFGGDLAEEKKVTFWRALTVRNQQLQLLRRLYGLEKKGGRVTVESKENKAAIQSGLRGKMRLHNNNDWRTLALAKFKAAKLRLGDDAKALRSVIQLLQQYMAAFTSHSPYNIDDFGSNYLSKSFPRDLTGRLIHDCGVYALRVAFILSLIRRQLNLRFRFVALPLHVGLVITGPSMPLWVLHNNNFIELTLSELATAKKKWRETTAQGAQRPAVPLDEPQFVGEIAARFFVPGTDTPFKLLDVPKPPARGSRHGRALWRFYTSKVAKAELFSKTVSKPGHPNYQFDLYYLEILKLAKYWHNTHLVPFWNVTAPNLWKIHGPAILTAHAALLKNPGDAGLRNAYDKVVKPYRKSIEAALLAVTNKRSDIIAKQVGVSTELQKRAKAKPSILTKGIRIQPSERFGSEHWVSNAIFKHILDLQRPASNITPPFIGKGNKVWPID